MMKKKRLITSEVYEVDEESEGDLTRLLRLANDLGPEVGRPNNESSLCQQTPCFLQLP